jgi:hypothetical protein
MAISRDIRSCDDVDDALLDQVFAQAGDGREDVTRLVERMARVAQSGREAHRIFEVLARLARAEWFAGPIDVMVRDFGLATEIDVRIDLGRSFEKVRTLSVAVPFAELSEWVASHPDALAPLTVFDTRRDDELRLRVAAPGSKRPRAGAMLSAAIGSTAPTAALAPSAPPPAPAPVRRRAAPPAPGTTAIGAVRLERRASPPRAPAPPPSRLAASVRASAPTSSAPPLAGPPRRSSSAPAPAPAPAPEAKPAADLHHRKTLRLEAVDIPDAAYRPRQPSSPERHPTARIPAVKPMPAAGSTHSDESDEGWE